MGAKWFLLQTIIPTRLSLISIFILGSYNKQMPYFFRKIIVVAILFLHAQSSSAELIIEITKSAQAAIPIAIVPFAWQSKPRNTTDLTAIITADLNRSGSFQSLPPADMLSQPSDVSQVNYKTWQVLGSEYLLLGKVTVVATGYQVRFQLLDVYKGAAMMDYQITSNTAQLRRLAHHISDLVYEKLTGREGVFSTHLAYITASESYFGNKSYKLLVADADGYNARTITSSNQPLMSPNWSPDGEKIAYVSFENERSVIYIQTLASGKRKRIATHYGINGAPAFSPDGKRLALTLSKDGSPDIYILTLADNTLQKLTKSYAIDTEPAWSPDGKFIVYTSDRGGMPQIYQIPSTGGTSKRLTFEGNYNSRAQYSTDGKSLAMVHANQGDYRIAVMDMETRLVNVLTAGNFDETPSFSPNGDMLLFASKNSAGRGVLTVVSVDGAVQQNMTFGSGDVREPAWSPK